MDMPTSKACTKCGTVKALDEFYVLRRNKDGRNCRCKCCVNSAIKHYRNHGKLPSKNADVPEGKKRCNVCKEIKDLADYRNRKDKSDGKSTRCRNCLKEVDKRIRERRKEQIKAESKRYYEANKEEICRLNREEWAENAKDPEFKEKQRLKAKRMYKKHAETRRQYMRERRKDPDYQAYQSAYNKEYHKKNRDVILPKMVARMRLRYKTDPDFRAYVGLRGVLLRCIRDVKTGDVFKPYADDLNYTASELKERMEVQFKPGMDWLNHGDWHIDHKIPVSTFLKRGETRPHVIHALSNLQPMWAEDNMSKGNRWVG